MFKNTLAMNIKHTIIVWGVAKMYKIDKLQNLCQPGVHYTYKCGPPISYGHGHQQLMQMPCIVLQQGIGLISLFHYFCIYVAVLHCCNVALLLVLSFILI